MARFTIDRSASTIRDDLAEASRKLADVGSPNLARAVDAVLAPGGWELLRGTDSSRSAGTERNLAISIAEDIRDQIRDEVAEDPEMESVTAAVNHGFRLLLSGAFAPDIRRTRGVTRSARVNLNVRPSGQLREQVSQAGYSPASIAAHYLMFRYGLGPYAADAKETHLRGAQRNLEMPRRIRDQITEAAKDSGDRVSDIVNEGFEKFLDGRFDPEPVVWSDQDREDVTFLKVNPANELFERVKQAGRDRSGGPLRPSQIAIAYLLEEFGLTAG